MTTKTLTSLALIALTLCCATTDKHSDLSDTGALSPESSEDVQSGIDGVVMLKDGTQRPLVSGLAFIEDGDPRTDEDDQLVVMLGTWELNSCAIEAEWYEHGGDDWNVITIEFASGEESNRVQVSQAYILDNGQNSGSEGRYFRRANTGIDVDIIGDLEVGQMVTGSVSTGDLSWGGSRNIVKASIASIEADFTVQFCGSISDI